MASAPPPTTTALKLHFLQQQIALLSQPLTSSSAFLSQNDSSDSPLRLTSIDSALFKLNATLKRHSKLSYGPQATRHVAEQIEKLYWQAGDRSVVDGTRTDDGVVERGRDFTDDKVIDTLPEEGEEVEELDSEAKMEAAGRYKEVRDRLVGLRERSRELKERLEGYRGVRGGLGKFGEGEEGVVGNVQGNLVGRGGELEGELERMKVLMARVGGRIEGLGEGGKDGVDDEMDVDEDADSRLKAVLALK